ncbi:MAG: hypothetical protein D6718_10440 [Acidobacteria bacterium]|nr:MAG: hypothetical protein D6718_10440 [Acidobacteriota bacterium]
MSLTFTLAPGNAASRRRRTSSGAIIQGSSPRPATRDGVLPLWGTGSRCATTTPSIRLPSGAGGTDVLRGKSGWLLALGIAAGAAAVWGMARRGPRAAPDIVLIVIDSLRADELDRTVGGRPVMPHLSRWAEGALRFTEARAPSCSTPTSVAAMLTSLPIPATHVTFKRGLPEGVTTIAQVLREAGYRTAAYSANPNVTARLGFDRGFDTMVEAYVDPELSERVRIQPRHPGWIVRPEVLFDLAWKDLHDGDDRPRFSYIHILQPHAPYEPPPPHRDLFRVPGAPEVDASIPSIAAHDDRPLDPRWLAALRARYDEHAHYADAAVGSFLDRLGSDPRFSRAAVVVLSDHGEGFGEHRRLFHNTTVYEEMLRIPMLWRLPGDGRRRGRSDARVDLLDVAPTLCAIAGVEPPRQFWGRNLLAAEPTAHRTFLAVARPPALRYPPFIALLDFPTKLIRNERTGEQRLFDLSRDPWERHDLSGEEPERLAEAVRRLESELARCRALGLAPGKAAPPPKEQLQRLRSLGYAD